MKSYAKADQTLLRKMVRMARTAFKPVPRPALHEKIMNRLALASFLSWEAFSAVNVVLRQIELEDKRARRSKRKS